MTEIRKDSGNDKKKDSPLVRSDLLVPTEIKDAVKDFQMRFEGQKTAFIIMEFGQTKSHSKLTKKLKKALKSFDIYGVRADEYEAHHLLPLNITTLMHGCDFGVAVFERISNEIINPNVSFEVGYMTALQKDVCLLKDQTMTTLPSDINSNLYHDFDPESLGSVQDALEGWLRDKGFGKD